MCEFKNERKSCTNKLCTVTMPGDLCENFNNFEKRQTHLRNVLTMYLWGNVLPPLFELCLNKLHSLLLAMDID